MTQMSGTTDTIAKSNPKQKKPRRKAGFFFAREVVKIDEGPCGYENNKT